MTVMNENWRTITCIIDCKSGEMLRRLEEMAAKEIDLDHIVTRTVEYEPGETEIRAYRLGDYFDSIGLLEEESNHIKLIFQVRKNADSRWKDLIMAVLRSLGKQCVGITVEFSRQPS